MNIKVIDYDRKTQFNDVSVETINKAWGNTDYVLVYKDNEFTGVAQPKGIKTLEEWQEHFEKFYEEQEKNAEQEQLEKVTKNDLEEMKLDILMALTDLVDTE